MLTTVESGPEVGGDAVTSPLDPQVAEALAVLLKSAGVSTLLTKAPRKRLQVYIPKMTAEARAILDNFTRTTKC